MRAKQIEPEDFQLPEQTKKMPCPSGRPPLRPHRGLSRITIITNLVTELADATPWSLVLDSDMFSGEANARSLLALQGCDIIVKTSSRQSDSQLMSF